MNPITPPMVHPSAVHPRSPLPVAGPSPNLNDTFLATVYQGELNVAISTPRAWATGAASSPRPTAAPRSSRASSAPTNSSPIRCGLTTAAYSAAPPTPPAGPPTCGLGNRASRPPKKFRPSIMGSDEFFNCVGGTGDQFLNAVRHGAAFSVGWSIPMARPHWTPLTDRPRAAHGDRFGQIEASPEAAQRDVTTVYLDTLGRVLPDVGGMGLLVGPARKRCSADDGAGRGGAPMSSTAGCKVTSRP